MQTAPPIPTDAPQAHVARRRQILERHPEVRELSGPLPLSALCIVLMVGAQLALAFALRDAGWLWMLLAAYVVGAAVSHGLYVMIHECTHDLVARGRRGNELLGIVCDLALALPGSIAFRTYHLQHHGHLGELGMDPDLAPAREARLVGGSRWRKLVWVCLMSVSQALRPLGVRGRRPPVGWTVANVLAVVAVNVAVLLAWGPVALCFLLASTLFALGPHPLGGRWIQEHYVTRAGQETYSYYGPGNAIAFNIGFHNEHHDFPTVPWLRLPEIRRRASEFYDGLASYRSWTGVILRFVLDPGLTPSSRVVRASRHRARP